MRPNLPKDHDDWALATSLNTRRAARENRPRPWLKPEPPGWEMQNRIFDPYVAQLDHWMKLSFETRHYVLMWLLEYIDASCHDFTQKYMEERNAQSPNERRSLVISKREQGFDFQVDLANLPWGDIDRIELKDWQDLFGKLYMEQPKFPNNCCSSGASLRRLRDYIVHRQYDQSGYNNFPKGVFAAFLRVPEMLQDWKRAEEVDRIISAVLGERHVELEEKREINGLLSDPCTRPCERMLQVCRIIESLCEQASFRYAVTDDRAIKSQKGWACAEDCELTICDDEWRLEGKYTYYKTDTYFEHNGDDFRFMHQNLHAACLEWLREMRITIAHKRTLHSRRLQLYIRCAIVYAILLHDFDRAVEIEIAAERYFEQCSRKQVLSRLYESRGTLDFANWWEKLRHDIICKLHLIEQHEAGPGRRTSAYHLLPKDIQWPIPHDDKRVKKSAAKSNDREGSKRVGVTVMRPRSLYRDLRNLGIFNAIRYIPCQESSYFDMAIEDLISHPSVHESIRRSPPDQRNGAGDTEASEESVSVTNVDDDDLDRIDESGSSENSWSSCLETSHPISDVFSGS